MAKQKNIYLHIGMTKTGSSAIQAYLSKNAGLMGAHGIDYPFPEAESVISSGVCTGNLLHVMQRLASSQKLEMSISMMGEKYIIPVLSHAINNSGRDRILFSGEFMSKHLSMRSIDSISENFASHKITVICCVRDVYYHYLSAWKQGVKVGQTSLDFLEFATEKMNLANNVWNRLNDFFTSGWDVRLVNYDFHKSNLLASFFQVLGLESTLQASEEVLGHKNMSISFAQAELITLTRSVLNFSDVAAEFISKYRSAPSNFSDPYFPDIDKRLLERHHQIIEQINSKLPKDQYLRSAALKDYSNSELLFSRSDLKDLLIAIKNKINKKNESSVNGLPIEGIPSDFDPDVYLLLNPDVSKANMDPYFHYTNHGKFEGRRFK